MGTRSPFEADQMHFYREGRVSLSDLRPCDPHSGGRRLRDLVRLLIADLHQPGRDADGDLAGMIRPDR